MAKFSTTVLGRRALLTWAMAVLGSASAVGRQPDTQRSESPTPRPHHAMTIRMMVNDTVMATATLDDNDSARQFAALLPLNLMLKDYAATEKIADLPSRLSTRGAPEGYTPLAGDVAYYAPWGNLAIFHKDFSYSSGLVRLGRLDAGLQALRRSGQISVRIERAAP